MINLLRTDPETAPMPRISILMPLYNGMPPVRATTLKLFARIFEVNEGEGQS